MTEYRSKSANSASSYELAGFVQLVQWIMCITLSVLALIWNSFTFVAAIPIVVVVAALITIKISSNDTAG